MKNTNFNLKTLGLVVASIVVLSAIIFSGVLEDITDKPDRTDEPDVSAAELKKFSSKEEFIAYLDKSRENMNYFGSFRTLDRGFSEGALPTNGKGGDAVGGGEPYRYSETNVQVKGIDEPDIVKTNGREIFFSSGFYNYYGGGRIFNEFSPGQPEALLPNESVSESDARDAFLKLIQGVLPDQSITGNEESKPMILPPYEDKRQTKIIKAFPPKDLKQSGSIPKSGDLLLEKDILIVLQNDARKIYGFDVAKPESAKEKWQISLEDNSYIVTARMKDGRLYLVTSAYINYSDPCPIRPLIIEKNQVIIPCSEIYYPVQPTNAESTFTAFAIDPETGRIENKVSAVGSSYSSAIYMSDNALYITYPESGDIFSYQFNFFDSEARDLLPASIIAQLRKIKSYDLSDATKLSELYVILNKYFNGLKQDERLRIENEFSDRMADYTKKHSRELEKTGIIKIGLNRLQILASGSVPGTLLNQFSLDEHENYLRVAVTSGEQWFGWGLPIAPSMGGRESVNDVYVLDRNLKIAGSVKDLGLSERIYSARFVGDKGYLVTFKQIDPFYVLDLSNPRNPKLAGELKIPGFSSYLDVLEPGLVLGIGQEGNQVKISLFDVTSASNPKELDKYLLKEYWSEVSNNHHAFLSDKDNKIFFLPGGQSGYVFSYENGKLKLERAVANIQAKRAIYINNYLYVIGDEKIAVLDERDWKEINSINLSHS